MDLDRRSREAHVVKDGRVRCLLLRLDVAVQRCWTCDRLIGFDVDAGRETVLCARGPTREREEAAPFGAASAISR